MWNNGAVQWQKICFCAVVDDSVMYRASAVCQLTALVTEPGDQEIGHFQFTELFVEFTAWSMRLLSVQRWVWSSEDSVSKMNHLGRPCCHILGILLIYALILARVKSASFRGAEISLDGVWALKNSNGSLSLSAGVPGCVHTALQLHKVIEVGWGSDCIHFITLKKHRVGLWSST